MDAEALTASVALARTAIPRNPLMSGSRGMSVNVHKFARWNETRGGEFPGPIYVPCNFDATGTSSVGLNFMFSKVSHNMELRALYDSYRIDKVELWFDYSPDVPDVAAAGYLARFPKLWIKRDYNDSTPPTLDDMQQSNQAQVLRFASDTTTLGPYFVRPACMASVFQDPSFGVANFETWGSWQKASSPNVPHFGVKLIAQGLPSVPLGAITVRVRYHLTLKNVR